MEGVRAAVAQRDEGCLLAKKAHDGRRVGELAPLPGAEVPIVGSILRGGRYVEVMVAGDPGDVFGVEDGREQQAGALELTVKGEARQVACKENVVRSDLLDVFHQGGCNLFGFPEVFLPPEQLQVEPADDSFGEHRPPGDVARVRRDMDVAEMSDPHGVSSL